MVTGYTELLEAFRKLPDDQKRSLVYELQSALNKDDEPWALEGEQLNFMIRNHNVIMAAYAAEDRVPLDKLEYSEEYRRLFGDMPWDEAFDRYEETWWKEPDFCR